MRNNEKVFIFVTLLTVIVLTNPASTLEPSELAFPCDVLFPKAVSFSELEGELPHYKVYEDKNGKKEIAGICYVVSAPAFSANIYIMVGLNVDHTVAGIRVLQHREAIIRLLGDFLREPFFYNQYKGKNISDEFRVGKDIDAITSATITNEVVARAVRDSSRQIAQAYLPTIEVLQPQREETYADSEKTTWNGLMDDGSIVNIIISGREDFIGLSLSFAYVNPPLVGGNILGPSLYNDIMLKYGTNQLFFVGITGSYDHLFDASNILIAQGENRIPVNGNDFISVKASGNTPPFKSRGIIRLQDKVDFTKPVTIVIYYTTGMGTFSKEYKLLDKYLVSEENQSFVPLQVTQADTERQQRAKGFDLIGFFSGNNFTILLLISAVVVIAIGILFRLQKKSMKLIFQNINYFTILALTILAFIGMLSLGFEKTLPLIVASIITASFADLAINYFKNKKIFFPSSAIIIGLIIGTLLKPALPLYIPAITSLIAILSKHVIKVNKKHIFNPANLGITATLLLFPVTLSWWGMTSAIFVVILGLFILYRLRKIQHIFVFFFVYVFLELFYTLITNQPFSFIASEVLSGAFLFFMFFMLTDPRTAPIKSKAKIFYGIIAAIATFTLFLVTSNGFIYGLFIANLFVPFLNKRKVV